MNAYHAQMEAVIGMDASDPAAVAAGAAVSQAISSGCCDGPSACRCRRGPPALVTAVEDSVSKLRDAAASNDPAAIKAAIGGLKMPYSNCS